MYGALKEYKTVHVPLRLPGKGNEIMNSMEYVAILRHTTMSKDFNS
jgi:hypothetical protein